MAISDLHDAMCEALSVEHGVVFRVSEGTVDQARQKFYQLRRADDTFAGLSCTISPTHQDSDLFIIRKPSNGNTSDEA